MLRCKQFLPEYAAISAGSSSGYQHATHFAYDVHGNVEHMVQDIPDLAVVAQQYKHIYYAYDLISGKVNQVDYNPGKRDEFHHRYFYDADNRITNMETSRDGVIWDNDANYEYYKHGPIARTEIGDLNVQGLDYTYTIQGWIKGINSNTMKETRDPGKDGDNVVGNAHAKVARDAFGFTLGYFKGDYRSIATIANASRFEANTNPSPTYNSDLMSNRSDLWNGNISHMVTCLPNATAYATNQTITEDPMGMAYQYDQLNRILSSRAFTNVSTANNEWGSGGGVTTNYSTDYTYDAMGNILTQKRNGSGAGVSLDDLTYKYHTNANGLVSNRLYMVDDAVASGAHADDIDDQGTFNNTASTINTANNYGYDELGNLNREVQEGIATIEWTVYGKISKVIRTGASSAPDLEFKYDASGNRMVEIVKPKPLNPATEKIYYYLRDAQGNVMCRYIKYEDDGKIYMVGKEHAMYGSSRLGVDKRLDTLYKASAVYNPGWYTNKKHLRNLGKKIYELANHLGNVLVTVTDKKVYKPAAGLVTYFEAEVNSITDYYPFGSVMSGRSWSGGGNRFGFNGKEMETSFVEGNYDFGARIYDGRLGRWLAVDPRFNYFSNSSCYIGLLNCPILLIDPDGKKVINGWTKLVKKAEDKLTETKTKFASKYESTNGQFSSCDLTSKKAFKKSGGTSKEWRQYKKDKKEVDNLEKELVYAKEMEKKTEEIISNFKNTAPDLFNAVDNAVSSLGSQIDALIYADDGKKLTGDEFGLTTYSYKESGDIFAEDKIRPNIIEIYINENVKINEIDISTNQYSLNHEFGHFLFVVNYSKHISDLKVRWPNTHEVNSMGILSPNDQMANALGQLKNPSKAQIEELLLKYKP